MGQCPSANGAAVGHTLQLALAAEPRLAPGLQIAYLQTSEFIFVARFDFPRDVSPSLPHTCPGGTVVILCPTGGHLVWGAWG